ncbi:hypothetical protein [Brucella sp. 2280]|uniref:hypothetical protein n=1 Tax=Brucella sp. 2280 TaxID=2592625 RepID=UPI001297A54C|nr:hypothetical protein [Brucella sp. 2280]QGA56889.1 hypothetical protein GHC20_07295 [Brucella sp. 2280]
MTKKAKGPVEAATSPSQVQTPDEGIKNMDTNSTEAVQAASELPVERINRLSRELSEALNEWMDGEFMAVILPANRGNGYPIMFGNIDNQKEAIAHQAGRAI